MRGFSAIIIAPLLLCHRVEVSALCTATRTTSESRACLSIRYANHPTPTTYDNSSTDVTCNLVNVKPRVTKSNERQAPASRRAIARHLAATCLLLLSSLLTANCPAAAFDNGIPGQMELYKTMAKYPGTPPLQLGLQSNNKLAKCDYAPNCFSTSGDEPYLLKLWKPPSVPTSSNSSFNGNNAAVMRDLMETIKRYPPGQARIDKGGFNIITETDNYLYVQFESLKMGFIDDVEFAVTNDDGGGVQVRSSSRTGFLDLGVNGKRLNWISLDLRGKGWTAPAITQEDYPDYYPMLTFTYDDYIRSVLSPDDCPIPSQPLSCKGISLKPPD